MIDSDGLQALLADIESARVEWTQSISDTDKFCEAICAFANDMADLRQPGYLIVGVDSQGKPVGIEVTERLLEALAAHRDNGQIIPQPTMNVAKLAADGKAVAVVEVFPSTMPPVRYKGRTHIRVGPRRAIATAEEERRLSERRIARAKTWDVRACADASLDDLSLDLFTLSYLPNAVARQVIAENQRSTEEKLAGLRLFDTFSARPTNAAVILFGKDPLSLFPGAFVQYVSYDGTSAGDEVAAELRITGDLLSIMRELDRLADRLSTPRPVRQPDLTDATVFHFPPISLHELLMNAVVHRNYEESTTPIIVNHFVDRIEIHNPGALYGDLSRDRFPQGVAYRNPILAEAAKTLGFVNRFGRGIAKAQKEMQRNGSPPVEFDIGDNHFAAIVRARP